MWARLDRQFLIKLAGEDEPARKASPREFAEVAALEQDLGCAYEGRPSRVDELMGYALMVLRRALKRHATAVRVASKLADGDRHDVLGALVEWHGLISSQSWSAAWAAQLWGEHIDPLLGSNKSLSEVGLCIFA